MEPLRSALIVLGTLAMACGGAETPNPKHASSHPQPPEPRLGTEWIYLTHSPGLEKKPECERVHDYVLGESECQSTVCRHGASLAADWKLRCGAKAGPAAVAEVENLREEYQRRAARAEDPCSSKIEGWLRSGCGSGGACEKEAILWATQCGRAIGSPLTLLMLEKTIEQSLSEPQQVTLDLRTCADYSAELVSAASCEQQFKCEDALPRVKLFRERCTSKPDAPLGLAEAIAEFAIRTGANQTVQSMPVQSEPAELTAGQYKVGLMDRTGVIWRVCSKTVADINQYVTERRACTNGDVTVLQALGAPGERVLRMGTFEHVNDQAFARRYPSLRTIGEQEARNQLALQTLAAAVDSLLEESRKVDASHVFCAAAGEAASALSSPEAAAKVLAGKDAGLEKIFAALGRKKAQFAAGKITPKQRNTLLARALTLVCADLDPTGALIPGASTPAALIEFERVLPRAMAAYRAEFGSLAVELDRLALPHKLDPALIAELRNRNRTCADALHRANRAERLLIDCAYGVELCDAEEREALGHRIDVARAEIETERSSALISIFSLPPTQQAAAREQISAAGECFR